MQGLGLGDGASGEPLQWRLRGGGGRVAGKNRATRNSLRPYKPLYLGGRMVRCSKR